jgi:hypothetical protein
MFVGSLIDGAGSLVHERFAPSRDGEMIDAQPREFGKQFIVPLYRKYLVLSLWLMTSPAVETVIASVITLVGWVDFDDFRVRIRFVCQELLYCSCGSFLNLFVLHLNRQSAFVESI